MSDTLSCMWRVIFTPEHVYERLRERHWFAFPLFALLITGAVCVAQLAIFTSDETYKSQILDHSHIQNEIERLHPENPEALLESLLDDVFIPDARVTAMFVAPILWSAGCMFFLLVFATYLRLVGRSLSVNYPWKSWFRFSCWTQVPWIAWALVTSIAVLCLGIDFKYVLSPLSWVGMNQPWALLLNLPLLWCVFISVQGYRCWSGVGVGRAVVTVLVPYVLYLVPVSFSYY